MVKEIIVLEAKNVSVLIVDHEESTGASLAEHLGSDYACVMVKSADEAMLLLAAAPFHLAITDITMVSTSGLPLCKLIRESYPDTVVVAASRTDNVGSAIEAMRQGAFEYIARPFDLEQVSGSIEHALRWRGPVSEPRTLSHSAGAAGSRNSLPEDHRGFEN